MAETDRTASSDTSTAPGRSGADRAEAARGSLSEGARDTLSQGTRPTANTDAPPTATERAERQDRMAAVGAPARQRVEREMAPPVETPPDGAARTAPDPGKIAEDIVAANTTTRNNRGGRPPSVSIDMQGIASDIVQVARTDPALGGAVYTEAAQRVDADRLKEAVNTELERSHKADAALLGEAEPRAIDPADARARADAILEDATRTRTMRQHTSTTLDVNEVAYDIEALAKDDPSLAVAVKAQVEARLDAAQNSDLNRIISGNATWGENIDMALSHPVEGLKGGLKGIVNGVAALGELLIDGAAMQASSDQYQAAGMSSLLGNDDLAQRQIETADALRDTALNEQTVPRMSIDNRAQAGGEIIGTAIDIALAGKGLITGGAKVLARNADELAALAVRNADEVARAGVTTADDLALAATRRAGAGLDRSVIDEVIATPKGSRPDPTTYMTEAQIDAHLARFDDGAARLTWQSSVDRYGTPGGQGGFAMPVDELEDMIETARTRFDTLEERAAYIADRLALGDGPIDLDDARIAVIEPSATLKDRVRMPTGNEAGANEHWVPGGYTAQDVAEATITDYAGMEFELFSLKELLE